MKLCAPCSIVSKMAILGIVIYGSEVDFVIKRNYVILCLTPDECYLIGDAIKTCIEADKLMLEDIDFKYISQSINAEIVEYERLLKRFE